MTLTEKDMQSQIEFVVRRFQEMMTKVDSLTKEVNLSVSSFSILSKKVDMIGELHTILKSQLSDFMKKTENDLQVGVNQTSNYTTLLNSIQSKFLKFDSDISELKNLTTAFDTKISPIALKIETLAPKTIITEIQNSISAFEKDVEGVFQHSMESDSGILESLDNLKKEVTALKSNLASQDLKVNSTTSKNTELQTQLTGIKDKIASDLESLKTFLLNHVSSSIAAIPKPVIPSLEDALKQMQTKVDPIWLDARNANLRSGNNESKIMILEKKVEQLQLLINKLQLQGQT